MWGGPLHNVGFIERVLAQLNVVDRETYPTMDRMEGMLQTALEEVTFGTPRNKPDEAKTVEELDPLIPRSDPAELDHHPFFFIPSSIAKVLHCQAPSTATIRGALRHAGFRVTMSHCKPGSIKTDASWKDIWHIMLEYVRQKAPLKNAPKPETAGYGIMSKGSAHQVDKKNDAATVTAQSSNGEAMEAQENGMNVGEDATATEKPTESRPSYLGTNFEVKFDEKLGKDHDRGKRVRYQLAPRENWGPMSRAK